MKIFIDSADVEEIKEAFSWGIVDGVTTNPSLIKKAMGGKDEPMEKYIGRLLEVAEGLPVSLEINGEVDGQIGEKQMIKEAQSIHSRFENFNINIKVPVNPATDSGDSNQFEGLRVIKELSKLGIPVNATLIMSPEQALLAAKAGAKYLSPFMGRIDDYVGDGNENKGINNGVDLMKEIMTILKNYKFNTEVIGASVRNVEHVRELGKLGVDIATIPFKILKEMITHEKTYEGVKKFKDDIILEYRALLES